MPPVVAEFHRQFPKVRIHLTGGVINTLLSSLLTGDIDVMCGTLDFPLQTEIAKQPLVSIRQAVVARKDHPLAHQGVVTAKDLGRYPWLAFANDQIGVGRIGAYFAANGLAPPVIAVDSTSLSMFKILQEGNFLAAFAEQMLPDAGRFGLLRIPQEGTFWEAEAGIAYRNTENPIKTLTSFISILKTSLS